MADCQIVYEASCQWAPTSTQTCIDTRLQRIPECKATRQVSYKNCTQTATSGSNQCTGWTKWFCLAWNWVTYVVCLAWAWVTGLVCILWAWTYFLVCVAWVAVTRWACVAISFIAFLICSAPLFLTNLSLAIRNWLHVRLQCLRPRDTPRNPLEKPGWLLTFEDDFSAGAVDLARWDDHNWWGEQFYKGELLASGVTPQEIFQRVTAQPPHFVFGPSTISLRGDNKPAKVHDSRYPMGEPTGTFYVPYTGAWIEWVKPRAQLHGYFEIRCKVPDTVELYPAFWLASDKSWPPEIDIFEFNHVHPDKFSTTIHWGSEENKKQEAATHRACGAARHFHIYACQWTPAEVRWYYDNVLIRVSTIALADFNYAMLVIVDSSPDTREKHSPENGTYPNWFEVDYVRAYRR